VETLTSARALMGASLAVAGWVEGGGDRRAARWLDGDQLFQVVAGVLAAQLDVTSDTTS